MKEILSASDVLRAHRAFGSFQLLLQPFPSLRRQLHLFSGLPEGFHSFHGTSVFVQQSHIFIPAAPVPLRHTDRLPIIDSSPHPPGKLRHKMHHILQYFPLPRRSGIHTADAYLVFVYKTLVTLPPRICRLYDKNGLSVILCQSMHGIPQIQICPMPEGIIRQTYEVKVFQSGFKRFFKPLVEPAVSAALIQMNHNLHLLRIRHCPCTSDSCIDQFHHSLIVGQLTLRKQQSASDFVPDLYHIGKQPFFLQPHQRITGKCVNGFLQLRKAKVFPRLRLPLISRIRPEIGIMEIQQKTHTVFFDFFCHLERILQIAIALCIRHTLRLVPKP